MSSFWERIKPATPTPKVVAIKLNKEATSLQLVWEDGHEGAIATRKLRQNCPCAGCVDEWTNQRTLDIEKIPEGIKVMEITPMGNYALALTFSDEHATGIFPWTLLHELE